MIESRILNNHLDKNPLIRYVLDVGCNFPENLFSIENSHQNILRLVGVDAKSKRTLSSNIGNNLVQDYSIGDSINGIVLDENVDLQFYSAYKAFVSFKLNQRPLNSHYHFDKLYKFHFDKKVQQYLIDRGRRKEALKEKLLATGMLKDEEDISDQFEMQSGFDLIIASKVLSHIWSQKQNIDWVLNKLIDILADDGYLYLKLNGKGFEPEYNVFTVKSIMSKIDGVLEVTQGPIESARQDGKLEIELIGRKPTPK